MTLLNLLFQEKEVFQQNILISVPFFASSSLKTHFFHKNAKKIDPKQKRIEKGLWRLKVYIYILRCTFLYMGVEPVHRNSKMMLTLIGLPY